MKRIGRVAVLAVTGLMLVAGVAAEEEGVESAREGTVGRASTQTCAGCHQLSSSADREAGLLSEEISDEVRRLHRR